MHIANPCYSWKIANCVGNTFFTFVEIITDGFCFNFLREGGIRYCTPNDSFVEGQLNIIVKYSLLNVGYIWKTLASVISMCKLHLIFLSTFMPRYFTLFTNRMFYPFNVARVSCSLIR
jgi:hypothetical protein